MTAEQVREWELTRCRADIDEGEPPSSVAQWGLSSSGEPGQQIAGRASASADVSDWGSRPAATVATTAVAVRVRAQGGKGAVNRSHGGSSTDQAAVTEAMVDARVILNSSGSVSALQPSAEAPPAAARLSNFDGNSGSVGFTIGDNEFADDTRSSGKMARLFGR